MLEWDGIFRDIFDNELPKKNETENRIKWYSFLFFEPTSNKEKDKNKQRARKKKDGNKKRSSGQQIIDKKMKFRKEKKKRKIETTKNIKINRELL